MSCYEGLRGVEKVCQSTENREMTQGHHEQLSNFPCEYPLAMRNQSWKERELWIRLSQMRHGHWPHVDFGLRKSVGGKTGEDMDQGIAGRSVAGVLQSHM